MSTQQPDGLRRVRCTLCGETGAMHHRTVYDVVLAGDATTYDLLRCAACGFVFVDRSQVDPARDYYGPRYYSHARYDERQVAAWAREAVPCERPARILDVGCGSGQWLFRRRLEGHDVWGLEADERAVAVARSAGLRVTASAADLPAGHFDFVRMSHVIEHTDEPGAMIATVARLLRPGGQLELLTPNVESVKFEKLTAISKLVDVPRHRCFFSAGTMRRLLVDAGLRVESIGWVPAPAFAREMLGDIRRLIVYAIKGRPSASTLASLLARTVSIHLDRGSRKGRTDDWISARAARGD